MNERSVLEKKAPAVEINPAVGDKVSLDKGPEQNLNKFASPEETRAESPLTDKEKTEKELNEMLSYVEQVKEQAKKEITIRQKIGKVLNTMFVDNTISFNQFFNEFEDHLKVYFYKPNFEKISMGDIKDMLEKAKEDKFQGSMAATVIGNNENGEKIWRATYANKEQTGRVVDKAKQME